MPLLTLARSYERYPGGFAIWPVLLKAPRNKSLLSTHICWYYRLIYYCYHITFGLEHFLSFNASLNSLWKFFSLLSVLENTLTVAHLSWYPPLIVFPLKLSPNFPFTSLGGEKKEGKSRHEEEANRERDFLRNEELEWKITKRSNILASEPFLQFTSPFFLLSFSLAISRVYPNAIVIDYPVCLVHCHIKQFMTAILGKSKVPKWACQEALPPIHLSRWSACPLHKLSDNPLIPATPQMKPTLEGIRCTRSQHALWQATI